MEWYKIDLPFESLTEVHIAGKKICIINHQQKWYACSAICPHAGGSLAKGYIDALGNIVCPIHHYRFNVRHGRNTSGEGYLLKTFPIEMKEDGLYIGIDERKM